MIEDNESRESLRILILKSQDGPLSESEAVELSELIEADGGAEESAALIDQLCALQDAKNSGGSDFLQRIASFPEAASSGSRRPSESKAEIAGAARWTRHLFFAVVASYLAVAVLGWWIGRGAPGLNSARINATDTTPGADAKTPQLESPQLVSMTACVWRSATDLQPAVGQAIAPGQALELVEGIAELRVGQDTPQEALVRIEGPAEVLIRNDGQIEIREGSLTMKTLGAGFRVVVIHSPIGRVFISGQSSIGLVAHASLSEVHLFDGQALVAPDRLPDATGELQLEAGDAVRYTTSSSGIPTTLMFPASLSRFVSSGSTSFDPLRIGKAYVDAVLTSDPSIYWRFEQLTGQDQRLVENMGHARGIDALVVGHPSWRQYGQNRVAELGQCVDGSSFQSAGTWPDKPLDEYAIELWVKPQLFHHGEILCLHDVESLRDGRHQHTMMLEATAQHFFTHRLSQQQPNRFRYVHRALGGPQPIKATSLFAEAAYRPRLWHHLVAMRRGENQELYVDGELVGSRPNSVPLSKGVKILIGQVYPNSRYRSYVGQVDEVAVYDRALSLAEIRSHIEAAGRSVEAGDQEAGDREAASVDPART